MHAFKAGVPAFDDAVSAVGEADGLAAVEGGVKLGAVGEIAGVVDGVPHLLVAEFTGTDLGVDVEEGVGGGTGAQAIADLGGDERGDVVELKVGGLGEGVKGLGAGCVGGEGGDLGRDGGEGDAAAEARGVHGGGVMDGDAGAGGGAGSGLCGEGGRGYGEEGEGEGGFHVVISLAEGGGCGQVEWRVGLRGGLEGLLVARAAMAKRAFMRTDLARNDSLWIQVSSHHSHSCGARRDAIVQCDLRAVLESFRILLLAFYT